MKKYRIIAYIVLITVIIIISSVIYVNANKNPEEDEKQKVSSEMEFLEDKLLDLLNMMNNIQTSKYKVTVKEVPTETQGSKKENTSSSENQSSESSSQGENKSEENSNTRGSDSEGSSSQSSSEQSNGEESKKYELELNGILSGNQQIDWKNVKGEIEELYISVPTITLDLYEININKDEILNFNKEYDNLIATVKNENKEEVLGILNNLYSYMPKFVQNTNDDNSYKTVVETKSYIISAYSKLDTENWDSINDDIKKAIDIYSKLLTDTNIDKEKQYSLNKSYVILNEIQNAVNIKDKSVFLIKYKNLIEERNNI